MTRLLAALLAIFIVVPPAARAQGCATPGYFFAVEAAALGAADSTYLQEITRALAYRWPVPSKRRESYTNWRRVRRRTLPPAPRWADDYTPSDSLRARFDIVLPRRGRPRALEPALKSGDVELVPGSLEFNAPRGPDTPPPSQRFATVKYDVNEHGQVVPSTVDILDSSDRDLADAIRAALGRARFRAAEQDCRPVTISVVQTFRG